MKSLKRILGAIRRADQTFSLIKNNDRIALGISGGKDSMVMLNALSLYQKFHVAKFEIVPVILDLGFPSFDASILYKYCESLGLTLHVIDEKQVYEILSLHKKDNKLPCSICSKMKKAAINKAANELGCNKVAFAHHKDDAIETLFMNEIYGGKIATFEPMMKLVRANITFIRPLIFVSEEDIVSCVKEENIPVFKSHCPNDGFTMRQEIKDILCDLYEKYPQAKVNFLNMLTKYELEGTWKDNILINIEGSKYSLRPVILKSDLLEEVKLGIDVNSYDDEFDHYLIKNKNGKIIGRVCALYINKKVYIKGFYLKDFTTLQFRKVISYFERTYLKEASPIEIIILDKNYKKEFLSLGYIKKDDRLTKLSYIK